MSQSGVKLSQEADCHPGKKSNIWLMIMGFLLPANPEEQFSSMMMCDNLGNFSSRIQIISSSRCLIFKCAIWKKVIDFSFSFQYVLLSVLSELSGRIWAVGCETDRLYDPLRFSLATLSCYLLVI